MTRIVGIQNRNEFIIDPLQAWHCGRVLDQMLATSRLPSLLDLLKLICGSPPMGKLTKVCKITSVCSTLKVWRSARSILKVC